MSEKQATMNDAIRAAAGRKIADDAHTSHDDNADTKPVAGTMNDAIRRAAGKPASKAKERG
jgi:hypothetical protein